jgi:hypothetical protein
MLKDNSSNPFKVFLATLKVLAIFCLVVLIMYFVLLDILYMNYIPVYSLILILVFVFWKMIKNNIR